MHPNAALLHRFYDSFSALDAAGMAACYHPEVVFSDPAFGELRGAEAGAMWAMLCARATDLEVTASNVQADDERGRAHWDARYTFGQTGRKVLNQIDAEFEFRDGLIVRHTDTFSFWKWARQALGPAGLALGWTPPLKNKVRAMARQGLDKYMRESGTGAVRPDVEAARPAPLENPKWTTPRLQADFNGLFGDLLCLSHGDTCRDESGAEVLLHAGMQVTAFEEDLDDNGARDDLIASGIVERSPAWLECKGSRWVLHIDEHGVRHTSDGLADGR